MDNNSMENNSMENNSMENISNDNNSMENISNDNNSMDNNSMKNKPEDYNENKSKKEFNINNNNNSNVKNNIENDNDFNTNNTMIKNNNFNNNNQKIENNFEPSFNNGINSNNTMIKENNFENENKLKKKNKKNKSKNNNNKSKKNLKSKINIKDEIDESEKYNEIINNISKINELFHIDLNTKIFRICFEQDFNIFPKPLSTNEILNLYKNNRIDLNNTTFSLIDYFKFKNCEPYIYKKLEIIKDENWAENIEKNILNFNIENNENQIKNEKNISLINENSLLNALKDETINFNESILPKNNYDEKFENFHRKQELENNWEEVKSKKNNKVEELNVTIKPGLGNKKYYDKKKREKIKKNKENYDDGFDLANDLSKKYKNKYNQNPSNNKFNKIKAFGQTFDVEYQ